MVVGMKMCVHMSPSASCTLSLVSVSTDNVSLACRVARCQEDGCEHGYVANNGKFLRRRFLCLFSFRDEQIVVIDVTKLVSDNDNFLFHKQRATPLDQFTLTQQFRRLQVIYSEILVLAYPYQVFSPYNDFDDGPVLEILLFLGRCDGFCCPKLRGFARLDVVPRDRLTCCVEEISVGTTDSLGRVHHICCQKS